MKSNTILSLLFFSFSLFSQEKGVTPLNPKSEIAHPKSTYAVVVGISDYQNEDIPDLRFADKDAAAFVTYLKSPAGGSLPDERLKVLTNQNATTAQIAAALEWLVEVSGEGDQAIIYFSGHGDVETKTMFQLGYLLTWDSPARTYVAGAFPLSYLQAVVSTLALQNKSEVALITDACRAGKLAGTSVGGAQITNANLSKQFANEVKILSCQPDEFSIEGEQWGGGRGVFSYHLVDGLYGLADNNGDGQVSLFEIGRYLEDKVATEAAPHSQFPMIAGSKNTLMAQVDAGALALLKEQRSKETPVLKSIDSKGFEEGILAGIDSVWQQKYEQFVAAVGAGQLLDAPIGRPAAYDLYLELSKSTELKSLHGTMQRNLAAALQDEAQQSINAYLAANPTELDKRYAAETDYGRYPRYLRKAAEVLGKQNFYYPYVMAKLHYFEGLQMRMEADTGEEKDSVLYENAIAKQLQALKFQEHSPFVLNELGVLHTRLTMGDKAVAYYEKAIGLAPEWGLPYVNLCLEQFYNNEFEKAVETGDKALKLMPDYPQLYNLMGWVNANPGGSYNDKRNSKRQGVELKEDFCYKYDNISTLSEKKGNLKRTIELLQKAIQLDSLYASGLGNLGFIYGQTGEIDKAVSYLKKSIEIDSTSDIVYNYLAIQYLFLSKFKDGESAFNKAIEIAKIKAPERLAGHYNDSGVLYKKWGKFDKALESFGKAIELGHTSGLPYINLGEIYYNRKDYEKVEKTLLKYREVSSGNPKAYAQIGHIYYTFQNRPKDAEFFFLKALELYPDYRVGLFGLARFYLNTGEYEKAQFHQEKLLEIAREDPVSYLNIGMTAYLKKDFEEAERYFQRAINLEGLPASELNGIGAFYIWHDEFEKAKKYLEKAGEFDPKYAGAPLNLAFCHYYLGQKNEAFKILDSAGQKFNLEGGYLYKVLMLISEEAYEEALGNLDSLIYYAPKYSGYEPLIRAMQTGNFERVDSLMNTLPDSLNLPPYYQARVKAKLGKLEEAADIISNGSTHKQFPFGIHSVIVGDSFLEPLRERKDYQSFLRRRFPQKFDDLDTFEFVDEKDTGLYYPENCLLLADYYESEGEHERAKFLREKAAELKAAEIKRP